MKEIYSWVPYFRELARKIADGDEQHLVDAGKRIAWKKEGKVSPLLNYGDENIDPFSVFYTIAGSSTTAANRKRIYESIRDIFEIKTVLPMDLADIPHINFGSVFLRPPCNE